MTVRPERETLEAGVSAMWALNDWLADSGVGEQMPDKLRERLGRALVGMERAALAAAPDARSEGPVLPAPSTLSEASAVGNEAEPRPSGAAPDARLAEALRKADEAASLAHDFIYGHSSVTQSQASDAIWAIHNILRPLAAAREETRSGGDTG